GTRIVAHANLWPRTWRTGQESFEVGLIGNVATSTQERGRGIGTELMRQLESLARRHNLKALILWSDLLKFYQNLGYHALGTEARYFFHRDSMASFSTRQFLPADAVGRDQHFYA